MRRILNTYFATSIPLTYMTNLSNVWTTAIRRVIYPGRSSHYVLWDSGKKKGMALASLHKHSQDPSTTAIIGSFVKVVIDRLSFGRQLLQLSFGSIFEISTETAFFDWRSAAIWNAVTRRNRACVTATESLNSMTALVVIFDGFSWHALELWQIS